MESCLDLHGLFPVYASEVMLMIMLLMMVIMMTMIVVVVCVFVFFILSIMFPSILIKECPFICNSAASCL